MRVTAEHPVIAGPPGRRHRRWLSPAVAALLLAPLVLVAGAAWWWLWGRASDGSGDRSAEEMREPAGPLTASGDPADGSVRFARSGGLEAGPRVEVVVGAPPEAVEMQIGTDPTFTDPAWEPVAERVELTIHDSGYQMLFARFRRSDGAVTGVSVDGVTIDPTHGAAVSSVDGIQRASWVRPLGDTALVVRVEAGRLRRGVQQLYDFDAPPPGDEIDTADDGRLEVRRDGAPYGAQVPGHDDLVRPYDVLVGEPLDGDALTAGPWTVTTASGRALPVAAVERISRPAGSGTGPDGQWVVPVVHDVILTLDAAVPRDEALTVVPPADLVAPIEVTIDPDATVSPLVHVNQHGFAPGDSLKIGYAGGLVGPLGGLDQLDLEGRAFRVVDVESGAAVHQGVATARPGGDELGRGDLTGAATWELDFSAVDRPGRYRLCVDGVGCSEGFDIDEGVWRRLAVTVARALYHQRSGVSLGPPYTPIGRPRPYHPDDGMTVTRSDRTWLETAFQPGDNSFDALMAGDTGQLAAGAWGGHFDAGDWDRNSNHLSMVRLLATLVADDPELWAGLDLGIPESGDAVPDLLDEALWTLDAFRRMQTAEGPVPGGIEAAEHPEPGSTSWTEDLRVYTFAPDPLGTFLYAGTAAEVAAVLQPYDPDRAADYLASAERAMAWATANPDLPLDGLDADTAGQVTGSVAAARAVAALSLFKAGGDPARLAEFESLTTLGDGVDAGLECHRYGRCEAAWTYLSLPADVTDPELRSLIEASIVATADDILAGASSTSYGFTTEHPDVPLVWGLAAGGTPRVISLVRAHQVTGDEAYRAAALRAASYSLGANPLNVVYLTGVGASPVAHPLIVDVLNGGVPVWPGTPVYGNHQLGEGDSWIDTYLLGPAGVSPAGADLPYLWQWFDASHAAQFNEYTVHQSHGPSIYAYGSLAATTGS